MKVGIHSRPLGLSQVVPSRTLLVDSSTDCWALGRRVATAIRFSEVADLLERLFQRLLVLGHRRGRGALQARIPELRMALGPHGQELSGAVAHQFGPAVRQGGAAQELVETRL